MRKAVYDLLKQICVNVFQDYPENDKDFPCVIFNVIPTAETDHDGIGVMKFALNTEIYAKTSEEISLIEMSLLKTLLDSGWVNTNAHVLPSLDFYRNSYNFETTRQGEI